MQRQPARHRPASRWTIIKRIFSLAIPITFGSLIMPLSTTLDLAVVPRRLQDAGFTPERATALYGQLTGMASSVIYFPSVVTMALSMSLVPAISEAFVLKQRRLITSRTSVAIKLTVLFAFPAAVGLYLLAEPITILLFNNAEAGVPPGGNVLVPYPPLPLYNHHGDNAGAGTPGPAGDQHGRRRPG